MLTLEFLKKKSKPTFRMLTCFAVFHRSGLKHLPGTGMMRRRLCYCLIKDSLFLLHPIQVLYILASIIRILATHYLYMRLKMFR